MVNVYYKEVDSTTTLEQINSITRQLLETLVHREQIKLEKDIPLKVHFGEKGNTTFIRPENFDEIIHYLQEKNINTSYIETNVLYGGSRFKKDVHIKTAKDHGFTQIPIIIADGSHGENFYEVEINKNYFDTCKLGKEYSKYKQLIVISHFKGHRIAGFGGAIKQLSMGCASRGGKLAMHMGIKPRIRNRKCIKCHLCEKKCPEQAIHIKKKSYIDLEKCVGCGACVAICPHNAITTFSLNGISRAIRLGSFREKVAEYALAAQLNKRNIYITFAMNITAGCDCVSRSLKTVTRDVGIFISTDPVAIDRACHDLVKKAGKTFRGAAILDYAEKINLGINDYKLIKI